VIFEVLYKKMSIKTKKDDTLVVLVDPKEEYLHSDEADAGLLGGVT
jgi:hypothetical protein